jgi:hypothetical protein
MSHIHWVDRWTGTPTDRARSIIKLNRRLIYECRCDENLMTKAEGSTRLTYTGLIGGLEHLQIETMLTDERFESVMSERVVYYKR